MTLYEICSELAQIENGLAFGEIKFNYGAMMCTMKPGHPADLLDDIFCEVGNAVYTNPKAEVETNLLEELLENFEDNAQGIQNQGIKASH